MKAVILQLVSDLIDENRNDRKQTGDELISLITIAKLDLHDESELHVKRLMITTIKRYVEVPDSALRSALAEYYHTLDKLLYNFC